MSTLGRGARPEAPGTDAGIGRDRSRPPSITAPSPRGDATSDGRASEAPGSVWPWEFTASWPSPRTGIHWIPDRFTPTRRETGRPSAPDGAGRMRAMEIMGIGTDIVECPRIGKMIEQHGELFLRRIYTEREIRYCQARKHAIEHFAGRWAAKEAILKAMGTGRSRGIAWTHVEVRNGQDGRPRGHGLRRGTRGGTGAGHRGDPGLDLALPHLRDGLCPGDGAARRISAAARPGSACLIRSLRPPWRGDPIDRETLAASRILPVGATAVPVRVARLSDDRRHQISSRQPRVPSNAGHPSYRREVAEYREIRGNRTSLFARAYLPAINERTLSTSART